MEPDLSLWTMATDFLCVVAAVLFTFAAYLFIVAIVKGSHLLFVALIDRLRGI